MLFFFPPVVVVDFPRLVGIWPLFDLSQLHGPAALAAVGSGQVLHGSAISSPGRGSGSGRGYQPVSPGRGAGGGRGSMRRLNV